MCTLDIFKPKADGEVDRMEAAYPLALVVSAEDGDVQASPLPLGLQRDAEGRGTLIGHFSRFKPHVERVRRNGRALETQIAQADAPYPNPWSVAEMGPRFDNMVTAIVPFRASIRDTQVPFKLGQGDPQAVWEDALSALEKYNRFDLATAMRRLHVMDQPGPAATPTESLAKSDV